MKLTKIATRFCAALLSAALLALPASAVDATYYVNPARPYDAPIHGIFHNQPANNEAAPGVYSVYLPETLQPWRPVVLALTPDGVTAKQFCEDPLGKAWIAAADKHQFALTVLEPQDGKWNLTDAKDGRNEPEYLRTVYGQIRSKTSKQEVTFTTDKSHMSLIGYGEGGAAAQIIASAYPAIFANLATVDAAPVGKGVLKQYGAKYSFPFPADSWNGQMELKLLNKKIPLPVWMINEAGHTQTDADYWMQVNRTTVTSKAGYANDVYLNDELRTRVLLSRGHLAGQVTPEIIWSNFMSKNGRFLGYAGGDLFPTERFAANADGSGYHVTEQKVDGHIRRWMTYVPSTYSGKSNVPMVLVMHGYSASMYALAEESQWAEVADKYGFIVVFAQAYLNEREGDFVPVPTWNSGLFQVGAPATDDASFLKQVVALTKQNYHIDNSRVYATGHSNGGSMTWELARKFPETFAAVAPIGLMAPGLPTDDMTLLMPSWSFKGEFDGDGMALDAPTNGPTLAFWRDWNDVDKGNADVKTKGLYTTYTYANADKVPLVQYTAVKHTPHAYNPDQSWMIWEQFFSRYTRGTDGTTYYNGAAVTR